MRASIALVSLTTAATLALVGCSSSGSKPSNITVSSGASSSSSSDSSSSAAATCTPSTLKTHSSGTLTVATDSPAYEPWFSGNKPSNGKGFESAVAFAVAKQLGYSTGQVKWVVAPFNSVVAPSAKNYDFDINEVSITATRAKIVDFSTGYYDVAQAVIALKKDKYSKATTIAGLTGAKLGAQKGTTSLTAITDVLKTGRGPAEYPTNDLAVQALKNGQIEGLVVDLPTGLYITAAELSDATIVGQLAVTANPEQFGLVLSKNNAITSCVSQAVDALRADGTLAKLQQQWLTSSAGAPELK